MANTKYSLLRIKREKNSICSFLATPISFSKRILLESSIGKTIDYSITSYSNIDGFDDNIDKLMDLQNKKIAFSDD